MAKRTIMDSPIKIMGIYDGKHVDKDATLRFKLSPDFLKQYGLSIGDNLEYYMDDSYILVLKYIQPPSNGKYFKGRNTGYIHLAGTDINSTNYYIFNVHLKYLPKLSREFEKDIILKYEIIDSSLLVDLTALKPQPKVIIKGFGGEYSETVQPSLKSIEHVVKGFGGEVTLN